MVLAEGTLYHCLHCEWHGYERETETSSEIVEETLSDGEVSWDEWTAHHCPLCHRELIN